MKAFMSIICLTCGAITGWLLMDIVFKEDATINLNKVEINKQEAQLIVTKELLIELYENAYLRGAIATKDGMQSHNIDEYFARDTVYLNQIIKTLQK